MVRPSVDTAVILEAAANVLARHGPTRTTMEEIAARAGVAKGVLYLRFRGKEALLRAVIDREMGLALNVTREAVATDPRGGLLSRLFAHSLKAMHDRPFLVSLYQGSRSPGGFGTDGPALHRSRGVLGVDFLRELSEAGMLRADIDASALAVNLAVWNVGLAATAPHEDVDALILSMGTLVARSADADVEDTDPGKECFARLADRLAETWGHR
ncbi:helix-turn-helix domain containing protein [Nocardiopsis sp. N85]|uniref:TetR/AcrR family transcriptional regulator n=1 Tax=Nocardiopsis sp. N85 TaxID=3029400 RepID=UPI00237F73D6|nr:TetR/AcrR family transcriptional regulator [Nocardiopsis sp. N85]MDE3720795.1 helix-turn-helix domain containing protein [Nocardiopsis sp. N85]